ncbi:hypothetical protein B9479_005680 [Cryptococcus floricola]|uniref:Uncharacterized protein n=1 Tax=Cryptococcus floricola TaxID=2591691 RepID=A0A5D3AU71_9TREE|nr:hypothetical protein B9479_005680 [Cryptococcus floricola]
MPSPAPQSPQQGGKQSLGNRHAPLHSQRFSPSEGLRTIVYTCLQEYYDFILFWTDIAVHIITIVVLATMEYYFRPVSRLQSSADGTRLIVNTNFAEEENEHMQNDLAPELVMDFVEWWPPTEKTKEIPAKDLLTELPVLACLGWATMEFWLREQKDEEETQLNEMKEDLGKFRAMIASLAKAFMPFPPTQSPQQGGQQPLVVVMTRLQKIKIASKSETPSPPMFPSPSPQMYPPSPLASPPQRHSRPLGVHFPPSFQLEQIRQLSPDISTTSQPFVASVKHKRDDSSAESDARKRYKRHTRVKKAPPIPKNPVGKRMARKRVLEFEEIVHQHEHGKTLSFTVTGVVVSVLPSANLKWLSTNWAMNANPLPFFSAQRWSLMWFLINILWATVLLGKGLGGWKAPDRPPSTANDSPPFEGLRTIVYTCLQEYYDFILFWTDIAVHIITIVVLATMDSSTCPVPRLQMSADGARLAVNLIVYCFLMPSPPGRSSQQGGQQPLVVVISACRLQLLPRRSDLTSTPTWNLSQMVPALPTAWPRVGSFHGWMSGLFEDIARQEQAAYDKWFEVEYDLINAGQLSPEEANEARNTAKQGIDALRAGSVWAKVIIPIFGFILSVVVYLVG